MIWRNALLAAFGAWFVVAAVVLNPVHSFQYQWNLLVLGGLTLIAGLWALGDVERRPWRDWLVALFGLELAATGWRNGTLPGSPSIWIGTILGVAIMVLAIWEALVRGR